MLLTTWGANNLIINQAPTISYAKNLMSGAWSYWNGSLSWETKEYAWEIHRYCQMSFQYVGMTYATATACANAIMERYTRNYTYSIWDTTSSGWRDESTGVVTGGTGEFHDLSGTVVGNVTTYQSQPMAQVAIMYGGGCSYNVVVNVNEDDMRMRINIPSDITSLYTAENARDYESWSNPTPVPNQQ